MYTDWKVGDEIKICVSTDMFCGQLDYFYFINDFDIQKIDTTCFVQYGTTTSCLDGNLSNLSINVYTVDESFGSVKHGICSNVPDNYKLRYLGSANTNSDGVCTINTKITEQDLINFESTPENQYKLFICIDHEKSISAVDYIPSITVSALEIPECISYTNRIDCEDNGCYWWNNNTCQPAPEGTTEYIDLYIKPHSWYKNRYADALDDTAQKIGDISGALINAFSSIIGYKYIDTQIFEDINKEIVIIRIYISETNETSMVPPVAIGIVLGIAAGIVIYSIGYVIGTNQTKFSESELTDMGADITENGQYRAYMTVYGIDKEIAIALVKCIELATTEDEIKNCTAKANIVLTKENQIEVTQILEALTGAVQDGLNENTDLDNELKQRYDNTIMSYNLRINDLENNKITPEESAKENSDDSKNLVNETREEAEESKEQEDCFIDNPLYPLKSDNPCLISDTQATWIKYGVIGVAGLYVFSTVAPIIKGTGKIFEKKVSK